MKVNKKQRVLLSKIGIDPDRIQTDDDYIMLEEKLSDYLQIHGITGDEVNDEGRICESILDMID